MLLARRIRTSDRLRRFFAAGCAALVFALTIFAASPVAHQLLHVDDVSQSDHDCAVVLFATGVSLPVGPVHVTPPVEVVGMISPATAAEVFLVSPRYLRQPERGPPALRIS
jgi:hypothetical protein